MYHFVFTIDEHPLQQDATQNTRIVQSPSPVCGCLQDTLLPFDPSIHQKSKTKTQQNQNSDAMLESVRQCSKDQKEKEIVSKKEQRQHEGNFIPRMQQQQA